MRWFASLIYWFVCLKKGLSPQTAIFLQLGTFAFSKYRKEKRDKKRDLAFGRFWPILMSPLVLPSPACSKVKGRAGEGDPLLPGARASRCFCNAHMGSLICGPFRRLFLCFIRRSVCFRSWSFFARKLLSLLLQKVSRVRYSFRDFQASNNSVVIVLSRTGI
jgi:hypothetical protein